MALGSMQDMAAQQVSMYRTVVAMFGAGAELRLECRTQSHIARLGPLIAEARESGDPAAVIAYTREMLRDAQALLERHKLHEVRVEAVVAQIKTHTAWVRGADLQRLRDDIERWLEAAGNTRGRLAALAGLHRTDIDCALKNKLRLNWQTYARIRQVIDEV
jgi:hypothetical protein